MPRRPSCGDEAVKFYDLMSSLGYLPSSPTLFNSGTTHSQMSSCYLLDSPEDSLEGIYKRYTDIAKLSKFAGGIGVAWHRMRAKNSLIAGTNGLATASSRGSHPRLLGRAVNQGGRRKGAACVYLESWHADIEDFLELRDNTGDHARRTHNSTSPTGSPTSSWSASRRTGSGASSTPRRCPSSLDTFGDEFDAHLRAAEAGARFEKQVRPAAVLERMMRRWPDRQRLDDLQGRIEREVQPDRCRLNEMARPAVVHLSNLCTEILEVTDQARDTRVCNLGSLNLGEFVVRRRATSFDFDRLGRGRASSRAVPRPGDRHQLLPDRRGRVSNNTWRPVGLG